MRLFKRHETGDAPSSPAVPDRASAPTLERLTNDEVDWVRSNIAALAEQDVTLGDIDDLGRHYDELLSVWMRLSEAQRPDPTTITTQIGLGFGQYVGDHARLDWAVATDEYGAEIALHRGRGDVLLFPTTMVAEHWAARDLGILPALARDLIATVEQLG
jgi:hypothetical protein